MVAWNARRAAPPTSISAGLLSRPTGKISSAGNRPGLRRQRATTSTAEPEGRRRSVLPVLGLSRYLARHRGDRLLISPVAVGRHREQDRQSTPAAAYSLARARHSSAPPWTTNPSATCCGTASAAAAAVARQDELLHAPQAGATVQLAEQPRRRGMHDIAQDGGARRSGGKGVAPEAAVHHTGDLDRLRISPRRLRGRADNADGRVRLGRVIRFRIDSVGDPTGQLEHPRAERGQVDGQFGA